MTPEALITHLQRAGVVLTATGPDRLRVDAPKGALTPTLRAELILQKTDLLTSLRGMAAWTSATAAVKPEGTRLSTARSTRSGQSVNRALLRGLGVRRLPLWTVCRQVSQTPREADLLYTALALADGLAVEQVVEDLRRVSSCGVRAGSIARETVKRREDVLTKNRVAAYISAHPFKWELGLKVEDYVTE